MIFFILCLFFPFAPSAIHSLVMNVISTLKQDRKLLIDMQEVDRVSWLDKHYMWQWSLRTWTARTVRLPVKAACTSPCPSQETRRKKVCLRSSDSKVIMKLKSVSQQRFGYRGHVSQKRNFVPLNADSYMSNIGNLPGKAPDTLARY